MSTPNEGPVPRAEWPEGCLELLNYSRHLATHEHHFPEPSYPSSIHRGEEWDAMLAKYELARAQWTITGSLHLTYGPLFEVARFATATGWAEYVRGGGGEWFKEKWCDDDDLAEVDRINLERAR